MLRRIDQRGARLDPAAVATRGDADERADAETLVAVRAIIGDVRARGDAALRELTSRFDGCEIDELRVPVSEIRAALDATSPELRDALEYAASRIRRYHEAQAAAEAPAGIDVDGIAVCEMMRAVDRAGLYVPGGRAAYPSTVLMTAIPAQVAGVAEVALCVPPDHDGRVPTVTLAAAGLAGVDEVYRVGGAQAIAALAYGTETIRPVDVVVGPGNRYVALAKREVAGVVGIDGIAGPSELVVVADATAPPVYVAADLAAQAEHGPDGVAVLIAWDEGVLAAVDEQLARIVGPAAPGAVAPRAPDIEATLTSGGRAVLVDGPEAAMAVANALAPEHLELMTADPDALLRLARNAGAVFCGPYAPAAMGDYVSGANHVLPTARTARFASALRVDDFRKHIHVVRAGPEGAARASHEGSVLARAEGLEAHVWSLVVRTRP